MEKIYFKIGLLSVILFFYNCKKEESAKSKLIKKNDSIIKQIKKGYYNADSYEYVDYSLIEWKKKKPESIFLENREPISRYTDSIESTLIYLNNASINRKTGANIYTENNFKSEIITRLPLGAPIHILNTKNDFKQYKTQRNKYLNGKWLEIEYYAQNNEVIYGYIFDDFINYHLDQDSESYIDNEQVVVVKNEKEFLEALGSNKTIEITANTLNFEDYFSNKFIKNNSEVLWTTETINVYLDNLEDILVYNFDIDTYNDDLIVGEKVWGEKYFVTRTGNQDKGLSLGLNGYENLIIRGKNSNVNFLGNEEMLTINKCNNILIENINFKKGWKGNGSSAIKLINSSSVTLNNLSLSNSEGVYIMKSDDISFNNSNFFSNTSKVINAEGCEDISIKNCNFFSNTDLKNIISINSRNPYKQEKEGDLLIQNCSFANNITDYKIDDYESFNKGFIFIRDTELLLKNSSINNNNAHRLLVNDNNFWPKLVKIENCKISNNIGNPNHSMFEGSLKIKFKECNINNNRNYYSLIKDNSKHKIDSLTQLNNKYDTRIDTIITPQNSIIINKLAYRENFCDKIYKYNSQFVNKKFKVLNGFHYFKYPNKEEKLYLFGLDLYFLPYEGNNLSKAYGKFIDGKKEDKWRFVDDSDEDCIFEVTYKNDTLDGPVMFFYERDSLLITGNYINGKKRGEWLYYKADQDSVLKQTVYKGDYRKEFKFNYNKVKTP